MPLSDEEFPELQGSQNGGNSDPGDQVDNEGEAKKQKRRRTKKSADVDTPWLCKLCKAKFQTSRSKMMECEFCKEHFCIKCLKMKANEYDAISKSETQCMWFCPPCRFRVEKNIVTEIEIEEKCKLYMEEFSKKIEQIETDLKNKCDIDQVKDIVKEEVKLLNDKQPLQPDNTENSSTNEAKSVEETVKEVNDRRAREANMIIFKAVEPQTNLREQRVREDLAFIEHVCNEICGIDFDSDNDVAKIVRLGKKNEDGSPRPLLVVFKEAETKKRLFRNLNN